MQSDTKAAQWYKKAADQGDLNGQAYLGRLFLEGRGVKRSDVEARRWLQKAAEQQHPLALAALRPLNKMSAAWTKAT